MNSTTTLKICKLCQQELPNTEEYFIVKYGKLRDICHACFEYKQQQKRISYHLKHYQPKQVPHRACDNCGKEFSPRSSNNRFCSGKCREESVVSGRFIVFERDRFQCIYCGRSSIEDRVKLHVDHIYPKSLGGEDVLSNLVTSCARCNLCKHNKLIGEIDRVYREVERRNKENNLYPGKVVHFPS